MASCVAGASDVGDAGGRSSRGATSGHAARLGTMAGVDGWRASAVAHICRPSSSTWSVTSVPNSFSSDAPGTTSTTAPSYTGVRNRACIVPVSSQLAPHAAAGTWTR